jgi:hypothetical protein
MSTIMTITFKDEGELNVEPPVVLFSRWSVENPMVQTRQSDEPSVLGTDRPFHGRGDGCRGRSNQHFVGPSAFLFELVFGEPRVSC